MQNWDALVRSVPRTTLSLLNPNAGLPDSSDQKSQIILPPAKSQF